MEKIFKNRRYIFVQLLAWVNHSLVVSDNVEEFHLVNYSPFFAIIESAAE